MLALGLLLNTVGLGVICWLIFTLAVYILPFFVATNAGFWPYHSGAGVLGTPIVAVAAGGMTLALAQFAFAMTQSLILRAVIAALFTLPATLAGYHVARDGAVRSAFACLAAHLCLSWRGLHRWHGMDTNDRLYGAPPARFERGSRDRSSTRSYNRSA